MNDACRHSVRGAPCVWALSPAAAQRLAPSLDAQSHSGTFTSHPPQHSPAFRVSSYLSQAWSCPQTKWLHQLGCLLPSQVGPAGCQWVIPTLQAPSFACFLTLKIMARFSSNRDVLCNRNPWPLGLARCEFF